MSSAPGIAVPGSSVPTSSLVTPGGAQGIQGIQGPVGPAPYTVTTADFTMPPAGSSVSVTVQDASWVIVGEMLSVQTAGGNPTTAASLRCTAKTGNQLTLLYQPPTVIPLASNTGSGLLAMVTGNSTDYVGGDNACHNLATALAPAWTVFTCTVTSGAGSIASQTSDMSFLQIGKLVFVNGSVQVTNIGTASGTMTFSLPVAAKRNFSVVFRENGVTGLMYSAQLSGNSGMQLFTSGNANPTWANNFSFTLTFSYEAA